ncbi:VOC family protein [Frankia sp. AgB1.9]|uniref:VOC family protein n=1 Tax=unclassified Frankia TaxID=2632575 RepID=UPI001932278E|nr:MULTISPECIES: VOC family protein [unclassified Frankia]MBL7492381.1 VOC family protein [Frankia sp. AgW1.1]MBL7550706.1 VOC family protein [Frankia sp. AgB1.9]MBL7622432.1 VOC family protein [Frankia sp. AgB1.8]
MSLAIASVVVDCSDALALARFWSELLGAPIDDGASSDWATVAATPPIGFARVPDRTPGKNALHLDLAAADPVAEVDRAIGLGAKRVADHSVWTTLADPEGNLFDIVGA